MSHPVPPPAATPLLRQRFGPIVKILMGASLANAVIDPFEPVIEESKLKLREIDGGIRPMVHARIRGPAHRRDAVGPGPMIRRWPSARGVWRRAGACR